MNKQPSKAAEQANLELQIRENNIVYLLPAGSTQKGGSLKLTGGAIIDGTFVGIIECDGILVIRPGATFSGRATANIIYVGGSVPQYREGSTRKNSLLQAEQMIALLADCEVAADLRAPRIEQDTQAKFEGTSSLTRASSSAAVTLPPTD